MLAYIVIYFIGYPISVTLMHKFHKELGMDYNEPKTYVNHDDWENNAQAFAGISVAWPLFWLAKILEYIIKKVVKFSAWIENELNYKDPLSVFNDKLREDNKQLQANLDKIKLENEELTKKLNSNEK
jgi:hypothetical protein